MEFELSETNLLSAKWTLSPASGSLAISPGPGCAGCPVAPMDGFIWKRSIFFPKRRSYKEQT